MWSHIEAQLRRSLACNVRRLRREHALTIEQAAHEANLHWRHWQKIESAETNATLQTIARIAGSLDVEAADLLRS